MIDISINSWLNACLTEPDSASLCEVPHYLPQLKHFIFSESSFRFWDTRPIDKQKKSRMFRRSLQKNLRESPKHAGKIRPYRYKNIGLSNLIAMRCAAFIKPTWL